MTPNDFIAKIAPAARASAKLTGIPASFTIGQAALESGWGSSKTTTNANNLFNIKADASWNGASWAMASTEYINGKDEIDAARWRLYPDWQACLDDRAKFFSENKRYADCFKANGGEGWARAVAAAGYATDPDYAEKLIATMRSHNLHQFDEAIAAPSQPTLTLVPPPPVPAPKFSTATPSLIDGVISIFTAIFGKK